MDNPFFYGNPVPPERLIGRERELRRIRGRIVNLGQSTAITGFPRSGKTSILEYLKAPTDLNFYGEWASRLIFSHIDGFALEAKCDQSQFWTQALKPLEERIVVQSQSSALAESYQISQQNKFGTFVLEKLVAQVRQAGLRLVLMIDGFDSLLNYANLNNPEFFGGLRSITSRSQGGLALLITGNVSLAQINEDTKYFNRTGSPYFNFLDEVTFKCLAEADIEKLLRQGQIRFSSNDYNFIKYLAGGFPCLLQVVASVLWDTYESGQKPDSAEQRQFVAREFYFSVEGILKDIWQSWPPNIQTVFKSVASAQIKDIPDLLSSPSMLLDVDELNLSRSKQELEKLERQGLIVKDKKSSVGWRVVPVVFLFFIADLIDHEKSGVTPTISSIPPNSRPPNSRLGQWVLAVIEAVVAGFTHGLHLMH